MDRKTTAIVVLAVLLFSGFAAAKSLRLIAHGKIDGFLSKGCVNKDLPLRTAVALDCPNGLDFSALDAYEDLEVKAMDLNSAKQIRADLVWTSYTGKGRTVAVLDTGIDYNNPELASSYSGGKDFVNSDSDPLDDNGHGTHVAGIITADGINPAAKGIAPDASVLAGKVLDSSGSGYLSNIIAAIYWAADNPAVDAISMSLGTSKTWKTANCDSYSRDFTTAVNYAVSKGKVVVAAAGNSPSGVSMPGCISGVIAVGAVDSADRIASFSGRGNAMKDHGMVAPGVSIYSTWIGGYATASGTSMATPMVSAVVTLMRQKNPSLSALQVKSKLFSSAKDLGSRGTDTTYGYGRVDAFSAVQAS